MVDEGMIDNDVDVGDLLYLVLLSGLRLELRERYVYLEGSLHGGKTGKAGDAERTGTLSSRDP